MKYLITTFAALAIACSAQDAPDLSEGRQELTLQGSLNLEAADDFLLVADIGYGRFFWDNIELGVRGGINASDSALGFDLGPFAECNFAGESPWVPFLGAAVSWAGASFDADSDGVSGGVSANGVGVGAEAGEDGADVDVDTDSDEDVNALQFGITAGLKYFLSQDVAISASYQFEFATDDVHGSLNDAKDNASSLLLGIRAYF